jgi:ribosomal protein L7/L12
MADVIKEEDLERFVSIARQLIGEARGSPIEIIKSIRLEAGCSLAEAKESYVLAANNESLCEYQERIIAPLIEELEEYERQNSTE